MAVYTPVTAEEAAAFVARYDLGAYVRHEGIAQGVSNSNFHLFTDRGRYILTLFEPHRVRGEDLPFFFAFSNHLAVKGIGCPAVFVDKDGRTSSALAGRPAAILAFLEGRSVAPAALTPDHCAQAGTMLARMHAAAADFTPQRESLEGKGQWAAMAGRLADRPDSFEAGLAALIRAELDFLEAHWPDDLPCGAVHADFFPDNVFFSDGRLSAVIDFYCSCTDFYALDLACVVNAWCFEEGERFDLSRARALLDAYQVQRPLSTAEKAAFQVLCRGDSLHWMLTRLNEYFAHRPDTLMQPHDPGAYLRRLRFHREGGFCDLVSW